MRKIYSIAKTAFAAVLAAASSVGAAMAQDVGEIATDLGGQINSLGSMLMIVAAVVGLGVAVMGLLKFKAHSANPNDPSNKVSSAFVLVFVGAAMVAVPAMLGSGISTIFGDTGNTTTGDFGLSVD